MIQLPNNCHYSGFNISPKNWKTTKAKLSKDWYIEYYFVDPEFLHRYPSGKPVRLKKGINRLKTLSARQAEIQRLLESESGALTSGYNPIALTKDIDEPKLDKDALPYTDSNRSPVIDFVNPHTPFIQALRFALLHSENVNETIADTSSVINSLERAAHNLGYTVIPIVDVEVKHIKRCLDECHRSNPKFSAKRFNKAKAYLSGLYKYLIQQGAANGNMAKAISPMKEDVSEPVSFNNHEIELVKDHLWKFNRPFYNFMMMFYYSGGRTKEFMRLQGRHVDLIEQTYSTLILKGKRRWVKRTIRNVAMPFWIEQMKNCGPDDYVFSVDLLPGKMQINSKQISRRWQTHVKKPLNINPTFYKLKHLNTDRTVEALSIKMAAGQNGHSSTKMVEQVYALQEKKRIHESLKSLDIKL